jgi:heat shock protein HtpX
LIALAWLLSQLVRLALSRSRELLADAGSVELTKNPDAMISALRKIENRGELPGATSAVMELCLDNPREGFSDLFATHPSVDARVQALVKFAGGHDPGRLALPSDTSDAPDDQSLPPPANRQVPPPLPSGNSSGPWGNATDPAGASQGTSQQGTSPEGASRGPWVKPAGPWGRH